MNNHDDSPSVTTPTASNIFDLEISIVEAAVEIVKIQPKSRDEDRQYAASVVRTLRQAVGLVPKP